MTELFAHPWNLANTGIRGRYAKVEQNCLRMFHQYSKKKKLNNFII